MTTEGVGSVCVSAPVVVRHRFSLPMPCGTTVNSRHWRVACFECFPDERRHVHDLRGKVDLTLVLSCATRKEATQEFQVGMSSTHTKLEARGGSDRGRASSVEFGHSNFLRHSHFRASYSINTALLRTAPQGSVYQTALITTACSGLCDSSSHTLPKSQQEYRLRSVFLDCQAGSQTGSADRNTRKHQQHTPSARINVYSSCELLGSCCCGVSFYLELRWSLASKDGFEREFK
jgi:hypothetical protein